MRRFLLAAAAVALLLGCQQSSAPRPQKAPVGSLTTQLRAEGDALAAEGQFAAAVVKYQAAVHQEPDDVSLRFALGSALSRAGRREETVGQFRWVVTHGDPTSEEAQVARRWLIAAGELAETVTFATPSAPEEQGRATPSSPAQEGKLRGRTEWRGLDAREGVPELILILLWDDLPIREVGFRKVVKLGQPYEFPEVPAGKYRLTGRVEDSVIWQESVAIDARQETVLDLTNANSQIASGDLPRLSRRADPDK